MDTTVYSVDGLEIVGLTADRTKQWILCLHGIQSSKAVFRDFFTESSLDKFSLLAPDFVGFGQSSKPESFSYDIDQQAHICAKIVKNLNITSLHIIGHSLGGMVGTLLLKELFGRVNSFINLEGNLREADAGLSQEVVKQDFGRFRQSGYTEIKKELDKSHEPGAEQRRGWLEDTPDYAFYKTCESIIKWSKNELLLRTFSDSTVRRLYVYGQRNEAKVDGLPAEVQKVAIPNAGHFMLQDNPKETLDTIRKFLE